MLALLIHGYKSSVDAGWLRRLSDDLTSRGFDVTSVAPGVETSLDVWTEYISASLSAEPDIVVAHSLGTYALLKALEAGERKIGKVILVAGFGREYSNQVIDRLKQKFGGWFGKPIDFSKIISQAKERFVFHSIDDDFVPLAEGEWLAEQLGVQLRSMRRGHLLDEQGEVEVPEVAAVIYG